MASAAVAGAGYSQTSWALLRQTGGIGGGGRAGVGAVIPRRRFSVTAAAGFDNQNREYVIVGGGNVAGYAARTFVEHGMADGRLCIVSKEKNEVVLNEEIWNEARTYGDIQLMQFVDYYTLILWKTIAICIYGTNVLSAKYVMKTDDDAFVRVDEILLSLHQVNISHGLLYGRVNSDSQPHRDPYSKWYITPEEWPEESYPPWAHGPGYVVSQDIAKEVYRKHKRGELKVSQFFFKHATFQDRVQNLKS